MVLVAVNECYAIGHNQNFPGGLHGGQIEHLVGIVKRELLCFVDVAIGKQGEVFVAVFRETG